jgi:hypothetical protein
MMAASLIIVCQFVHGSPRQKSQEQKSKELCPWRMVGNIFSRKSVASKAKFCLCLSRMEDSYY